MSFETTRANISNIEKMSSISSNDMLAVLEDVYKDVLKHNGVENVEDILPSDVGKLLLREYALLNILLPIYNCQKDAVVQKPEVIRNEYIKIAEEAESALSEIALVKEDIENTEKKREELKEKKAELDAERATLIRLKEDCEKLQEQISVLEDTSLEQFSHEKEKLEQLLNEKQKEEEMLKGQKKQAENKLEDMTLKINTLVKTIDNLKKNIVSTGDRENKLSEEKLSKENELNDMRQRVDEYEQWLKEFPARSKDIESRYKEQKAEFTVMQNAWKCVLSDKFLMETLYKLPHRSNILSVKSYPDFGIMKSALTNTKELQDWFSEVSARINGLLSIYEEMIKCIVKQGELITAEQSVTECVEDKNE